MKTVTLGVTGHRFLAEMEKINAGMEQAVACILAAYPGYKFRVLSSLAEGADRLLAKRLLLLPGAHLWVPLPLPEQEYLKDFASPTSQREFNDLLSKAGRVISMPPSKEREQGYLAAGMYVLDHSDVLLAVWDGQSAQGVAGTAGIVAQARAHRLPLAWIHAGNRLPGTNFPTSLGEEQGKLTCENFPPNGRKA
jgi:hypothetical protein